MLNFRLLYALLDKHSIQAYLRLVAGIGIGTLADIIIFFRLSLLVGPWITMAILAGLSTFGIVIVYHLVDFRSRQLADMVDEGLYQSDAFSLHLITLIAGFFLIIPGLLSTLAGAVFLIPPLGASIGKRLARMAGIEWCEAYEYLRLERITQQTKVSLVES